MKTDRLTKLLLEKPPHYWPGILKALRILLKPVPAALRQEIRNLINWAAGRNGSP